MEQSERLIFHTMDKCSIANTPTVQKGLTSHLTRRSWIKLQHWQAQAGVGRANLTELRLLQDKLPETAHIPALLWLLHVLILMHFTFEVSQTFPLGLEPPKACSKHTELALLFNNEAFSKLTVEPEGLGTGSERCNYWRNDNSNKYK